jgi:hypothetical protein
MGGAQTSPYTPLQAFLISESADEAGLPPATLNAFAGDIEAGQES